MIGLTTETNLPMSTPSLQIGSHAPDFSLDCTEAPGPGGRHLSLADYRGYWLILVFYPRDFSLVCPTELLGLSRRAIEFRDRGCEILGVSCDPLVTHETWVNTPVSRGGLEGLNYPLASDDDGATARAYGVYLEIQKVALRGLFIIDPNGVLQFQVIHNLSVGRRSDDIMRVLTALQTGGLCAENWMTPNDTIDPIKVLRTGSVVSHYRIEDVIGSGSFAVVYRARDLTLDRTVALKVFKPEGPMTASTVLAEARSAAALNHPNVCTVFGVDDSLGVPTIAMEFVPGRQLSKILAESALDASRAAAIGRQIAAGMASAHANGVVHGDLKPENIMVGEGDFVKILDFGLARRSRQSASADETLTLGIAEGNDPTGLFGTPTYLSPEQTLGESAAEASDVFALGLILFEMITGQKAIAGSSILAVLDQIRTLDAKTLGSRLPEPFASIVIQTLHPLPEKRSITMSDIADALTTDPVF